MRLGHARRQLNGPLTSPDSASHVTLSPECHSGAARVARANSSAASVPHPARNAMLAWRRKAPTSSGARLFKQHSLYLRPLPQGHGSFLPGALTPSVPKPIGQCGFWS